MGAGARKAKFRKRSGSRETAFSPAPEHQTASYPVLVRWVGFGAMGRWFRFGGGGAVDPGRWKTSPPQGLPLPVGKS